MCCRLSCVWIERRPKSQNENNSIYLIALIIVKITEFTSDSYATYSFLSLCDHSSFPYPSPSISNIYPISSYSDLSTLFFCLRYVYPDNPPVLSIATIPFGFYLFYRMPDFIFYATSIYPSYYPDYIYPASRPLSIKIFASLGFYPFPILRAPSSYPAINLYLILGFYTEICYFLSFSL